MSLMFQRNARNYAVNGYYPTDDETLKRICNLLAPASNGALRLLDPCCGEGDALKVVSDALATPRVEPYGIEIDEERAWGAKSALTRVIHADIQDCAVGLRQFGLLFLNPPYGRLVSDQERTGRGHDDKRLEKLFYRLTVGGLQFRGIMVLIIPRATLDEDFAKKIGGNFRRVRVFEAPEQRFNQLVVIGEKVRASEASPGTWRSILDQAEASEVMPEIYDDDPYTVPAAPQGAIKLHSFKIDERQLAEEIAKQKGLWAYFDDAFTTDFRPAPRPLCQPCDWHLALMLAGGAISGLVENKDRRRFVVSGDTMKVKAETVSQVIKDDDTVETVTTRIDKFVPAIRALDMSPTSTTFGQTLIVG